MAIPFATLLPQLIGAGTSLAAALPNARDKQNRQIAMGGEDPALQAIRAQLSAQNAANARMTMSIAANQQGVNPALAQRNAAQALAPAMAQQQMQTNAEIARLGANSAMQARQTDSKGQKISAALSGVGQFANVFGTGLATQNAGMDAAGTPPGGPAGPIAGLVKGALGKMLGGGSPTPAPAFSGGNYTAPAPTTFGMDLPAEAQMPVGADGQPLFDPTAPSAAAGVPSAQLQTSGQTGSGVGGLGTFQTPPAATPAAPAPQVAIPPVTGLQLPQSTQVPASQAIVTDTQPTGPSPQGQMVPGQGAGSGGGNLGPQAGPAPLPSDPRTWASPQERPVQSRPADALPPELVSNPQNAGLIVLYEEAVARGDDVLAGIFLRNMQAVQGMSTTLPPITTPRL